MSVCVWMLAVCVSVAVSVGESDEWRFESKLGQSLRLNIDAASVNIALSDTFTDDNDGDDDISLLVQAVAALVSADQSTSNVHSSTQLKVSSKRPVHNVSSLSAILLFYT